MQIVIDISEEAYEHIKDKRRFFRQVEIDDFEGYPYFGAILDGTVLPKGHEKLIAEPTEEDIAKTIGGQNDFAECIREAVKAVFDNAPTIIEADKSGK